MSSPKVYLIIIAINDQTLRKLKLKEILNNFYLTLHNANV